MLVAPMFFSVFKIEGVPTTSAATQLYLIVLDDFTSVALFLYTLSTLKWLTSLSQETTYGLPLGPCGPLFHVGLYFSIVGVVMIGSLVKLNEITNTFSS